MSVKINPVVFREYDIRGVVETDLSEDFAFLLGRAFGKLAKEHQKSTIAIGRDCRLTSEAYAMALAHGLAAEGVNALLTGMGPTPQLYFSLFNYPVGGGIQVTGSHNPSNMNGFKLCLGTLTLSGADIQDLKARVIKEAQAFVAADRTRPVIGEIFSEDVRPRYIQTLIDNARAHIGARKLKVVVDAGNGVGGMVGPEVLRALGLEVVELYCEPDGRFPNHHPDPTELKNIVDLVARVKAENADFGIGWDGDADRIGVVDEQGKIIFGDMLLLIYAREILKTDPGATIVGDVKCSSRLFDDLRQRGANALMWKTGHSLIKSKLNETQGALGGEMSGHIFFKHRWYGFDDAIYASVRFAEIMSHTDKKASALLSDLPAMVSTPEIRVDCPEEVKFKIPQLAKEAFSEYPIDTTDGVRIGFENGWGLVRASNTQPVLVMRFEARDEKSLESYEHLVKDRIQTITKSLI